MLHASNILQKYYCAHCVTEDASVMLIAWWNCALPLLLAYRFLFLKTDHEAPYFPQLLEC